MKTKEESNLKSKLYSIANGMGAWLIILILIVVMSVINSKFLTVSNFINVFRQVCVVGICSLGVSFVVLGGEIDLSSGMGATFAGCNAALLITKCNLPMWLAIIIAIAIGALVGAFSGLIVTYWKIPSFIGTLGVQYVVQGLILITTNSMPVTGLPDGFLYLGRGYIADVIPVPVVIMILFFIVGAFLLIYSFWTICNSSRGECRGSSAFWLESKINQNGDVYSGRRLCGLRRNHYDGKTFFWSAKFWSRFGSPGAGCSVYWRYF